MDVSKISIRGRVAISVYFLEEIIKTKNLDFNDWEFVLNQLWKFTSAKFLDEWQSETVEILPNSILEFNTYELGDFECLSKENFKELQKLYNNSDPVILKLVAQIYYLGTIQLFGKIVNGGIQSIQEFDELFDLINKEVIIPEEKILPNKVKDFTGIEDNNGWGHKFTREEFYEIF